MSRIVVVGAGYASVRAVQQIEPIVDHGHELLWIADVDHHFVLHESHTVITNPHRTDKLSISPDDVAPKATFQQARMVGLTPDEKTISLANGSSVSYDYLVLGVGAETADYGIPGVDEHGYTLKNRSGADALSRRIRMISTEASAADPGHVVVGGGGLSGIQIAGEIAAYRDRGDVPIDVTIVEAGESIMPHCTDQLRNRVESLIEKHDIRLILGDPVEKATESTVHTASQSLPCDLFVWAGGNQPRDEIGRSELQGDSGYVPVDATLRTDAEDIYAAGDMARAAIEGAIPAPTAQAAWQAGEVAGKNVVRELRGDPLLRWDYTDRGTLVSVGPDVVLAGLPPVQNRAISGLLPKLMKWTISWGWRRSATGRVSPLDVLPSPTERQPVADAEKKQKTAAD